MSNRMPGVGRTACPSSDALAGSSAYWALSAVAVAGFAFAQPALAAPALRILNHEQPQLVARTDSNGQQRVSFEAYGKRFDLVLESNDSIARAVPAERTDLQPFQGTLDGQPGSWVRLTRSRGGWRGVVSDGSELYAIEPATEAAEATVQPLTSTATDTPVMYRLADALLPPNSSFCGTVLDEDSATEDGRPTELKAYKSAIASVTSQSGSSATRQLTVGVVTDHAFTDAFSADPIGAIIARMDIVDGIFSTQVGVKIALATPTISHDGADPFSDTTVAGDLLAEVRDYRNRSSAGLTTGVTHLMTGRTMDASIVGIAYLDSVCDAQVGASLSQGTNSTMMSALTAAHELGHNFSAPHDGQPGACAATPQTFLMAPKINMNNQFSDCSLEQIEARVATARCLTPVSLTSSGPGTSTGPDTSSGGSGTSGGGGGGGGGRVDLAMLAFLAGTLTVSLSRAVGERR